MAIQYSIQKMVSDGTLSTIALGIQYLQRNDIYIRIAGEETPQSGAPSGYTWSFLDNTTLKILPVVPNGVGVVVYRRTDVDAMYNIYSQNAQFDEATIDENNQQLLYIAQEYLEQGLPGAGVDTIEYVRDDGYFTYYRLRRTDGSYSEEFTVPSASSSTKVLTRESLRRSYAEAGYNLVDGSFESGGTLVNANDVLLQERTGKAFSGPAGVVAAGTDPASGGFVDRSGSATAFIQEGAGAVPRTAQDKMREVVSVKDFGAVGDGVTDDTAAIQAALNSGAAQVLLNAGTYNTTVPIVIPSGVSFVGEGQRLSKIKKNHAGDGVTLTNALAYNGLEIGGFSVYAVAPYKQTGTGVKITQAVRTTLKDINVSDCGYGLSMLTCYANSSNNLTIDRCGVGLSIQTSNHNKFNVTTIISDTGFIGVEMIGTSYSNNFDTLDVEYALYPLWLKSGTTSVTFTNYYAEFNTNGARLDAGVKAILFNTVFNSSVEMFDTATFAATSVEVNNLVDDSPVGIGGVSVRGNIGTPGISTTQNDVLFQLGVLSAAYDFSDFSKFGLNAGSYFEWTGEPRKNYINAQDLSNGAQWVGSGTVEAVGSPTIGGVPAYRFAAGAYRTHAISTDTTMAGRTFTVCVLVNGPAGAKFVISQTDNVTETRSKTYVLGAGGKRYVFHTASWGAGSTGPNIGFTIGNTGSASLDFAMPCIWESPGPLPLTARDRNASGYTSYPIVTFQNFGSTVKVFGAAAPATGSWKVGDVVMHTAPAAAGSIGWVCTAAGTPGTWKTFGAIAP